MSLANFLSSEIRSDISLYTEEPSELLWSLTVFFYTSRLDAWALK